MTKIARRQQLTTHILIATAAAVMLAGCSQGTPNAGPTTTAVGKPAPSCAVNPSSAPVPSAEELRPVPEFARISVALSGIPSATVKPGDPPTEVDVTLCNNSPVAYPEV